MSKAKLRLIVLLILASVGVLVKPTARVNATPTTRVAAGCALSDLLTTWNASADGDTITIPTSTCGLASRTWSTSQTFANTKGVTFTCDTNDSAHAIVDTYVSNSSMILTQKATNSPIRVTNCYFDANHTHKSSVSAIVLFQGAGNSAGCNTSPFTGCYRFDHNTINNLYNRGVMVYSPSTPYVLFGVIDHNSFNCTDVGGFCQSITDYGGGTYQSGMFNVSLGNGGTSQATYAEDNTFTYVDANDGLLEAYNGASYVFRFNHIIGSAIQGHHGADSSGGRGPRWFEIYANDWSNGSGVCLAACSNKLGYQFRSGTGFIWHNRHDSTWLPAISPDNYRSAIAYDNSLFAPKSQTGTVAGPYNIVAGSNDKLSFIIDAGFNSVGSPQTFTIDPGASVSTASIVTKVNATISRAVASESADHKLVITTSNLSSAGTGQVWVTAVANDAYSTLGFTATPDTHDDCAGGQSPADGRELYSPVTATRGKGKHCLDGIGTIFTATLDGTHSHQPLYTFDNRVNSTTQMLTTASTQCQAPDSTPSCIQLGGDILAEADFRDENGSTNTTCSNSTVGGNGTCGTGVGSVSAGQRPATCSAGTLAGQGVGFWATDEGSWNDGSNALYTGQGRFYKCTATNTWTLNYTPYTYPHPMTLNDVQTPTLTGINPSGGNQGQVVAVTLTGTRLNIGGTPTINISGTGVTSSGIVASLTSVTANFTIASSATVSARTVSVTTSEGTTSTVTFNVLASAQPAILNSIVPASGFLGSTVSFTLTGSNFTGGSVAISGTLITVQSVVVVSDTSITGQLVIASNASLTTRSVTVTNAVGTSNSASFQPNSNGLGYRGRLIGAAR